MKRTFCDRCGEHCVNTTTDIRIEMLHHTKDGHIVAEDNFKAIEICNTCTSLIKALIPNAFVAVRPKDEEAMMAMREPDGEIMERPVR